MAINQNPWHLVPGTRKRRSAKNHLVKNKNKNNHKKSLKTKNQKIFINIGTWNVRTLNNEGNLDLLLKNMKSFNIKILGVAETHWNNSVEDTFQQNGYVIIHSARKDEIRRQGVAIVIEKELSKCMTSYALTSERIMSVTLKTNTGSVTIIQVYAPDSNYDDDEVENFYNILQQEIDTVPKKSTVILIGDFNARVGTNY